jgi:esterase/lipase superfamily enzyme
MRREEHRWFSGNLGHDMDLVVYGHAGKPLVCFPSKDGRTRDWESFGMVAAMADMLEQGKLMMFALDGIDWQSWTSDAWPGAKARRHNDYHRYVTDEVMPLVRAESGHGAAWTTGCSMGAFHAANFFFRRPDVFDGVIAMSGVYNAGHFTGEYSDDEVYFNSPIAFLPNLGDLWHLDLYRRAYLVFCVGQGAFEEPMISDTHALQEILHGKGIYATFDYWGADSNHDWPWWRQMLRHHLEPLWHG